MSFKPSSFSVGGGLLDDVDVTIREANVVTWDYNGSIPVGQPAIRLLLAVKEGEDVEQYWTLGKAEDWMPSDDGKKIIGISGKTQMSASSNAAILLISLVKAGFPENRINDEDIGCFTGTEGHVARIPAPKRPGLGPKAPRADGRVFEDTILTFSTITKLPWEKGGAKATTKGKATAKAAEPAPEAVEQGEDETVEGVAQGLLLEILGENPKGITKQQIPGLVFKKVGNRPDRNAIVQLAFKDTFLAEGPWTYEGGKLTS